MVEQIWETTMNPDLVGYNSVAMGSYFSLAVTLIMTASFDTWMGRASEIRVVAEAWLREKG